MTQMESELFKGTAEEFMKSYKDGGMVYLESKEKDEIIQDMKDMELEIERLKERLSLYESDNDTVIMTGEKCKETKNEIERLNNTIKYILNYLRGNEKRLEKNFPYDSAIYGEIADRLERKLKGVDKE